MNLFNEMFKNPNLSYDEVSEIIAIGGLQVRYPQWKWGEEYEEFIRDYRDRNRKYRSIDDDWSGS